MRVSKRAYGLWFTALVLVSLAALLSVLRAGVALPQSWVDALSRDAQQRAGAELTASRLTINLDGRSLLMTGRDVSFGRDGTVVQAEQAAITLDLWSTVRLGQVAFDQIDVTGVSIELSGAAGGGTGFEPENILGPLLLAKQVEFAEVQVSHPQFDLLLARGRLRGQSNTAAIEGRGRLSAGGLDVDVSVLGELRPDSAGLFVSPQVSAAGLDAKGGLWVDWQQGVGSEMSVDLNLLGERTDLSVLAKGLPGEQGWVVGLSASGVFQTQAISIPAVRLSLQGSRGLLETGAFRLPGVTDGLLGLLPNAKLAETLAGIGPSADVNNVWFAWGEGWRLHVDATNADGQPYRNIPGGRFDTRVSVDAEYGIAQLFNISRFHSLRVDDEPDTWEDGAGQLIWRRSKPQHWQLVGREIFLSDNQSRVDGAFRLDLAPQARELSLLLGARSTQGHSLVPQNVLPDNLSRWWAQATPEFATQDTRVWVNTRTGRPLSLNIVGDVSQGSLLALSDWPRVSDLSGTLELRNGSLTARADAGRMGEVSLNQATLTRRGDAFDLSANAQLAGSRVDVAAGQFPIDLSAVTDNLAIDGTLFGQLDIEIPSGAGQLRVGVNGVESTIKALSTGVSDTQGEVTWDLARGLQGGQFEGTWQGAPVSVTIEPDLPLSLAVQGLLPLGWATRRYAPFLDDFVSGQSDFQASLRDQAWTVEADIKPGQLNGPRPLQSDGLLRVTGEADALKEIVLGANRLQFDSGIRGTLTQLDGLGWADVFSGPSVGDSAGEVALSVETGFLGDLPLGSVEVLLKDERLSLNGPQIDAAIALSDPVVVNVENIELFAPKASENATPAPGEAAPEGIPDIDVAIKRLVYNEYELFNLTTQIRSEPEYVAFNNLGLTLGGAKVVGTGRWSKTAPVSEVDVNLDLLNLGEFMQALDLGRPVETGAGRAFAQLSWPAEPWAPDFTRASGEVTLETAQGRLTEGPQAAEALRLFGVLNLSTLTRRLNLDFSDLLQPGLAFDRLTASASLTDGDVTLTEPLRLEGPGATFVLSGSNSLETGVLDHELLVQVPLSAQLPAASLLAGFPAIAAGIILLVERAAGEDAKRFGQSRYSVTGTFDAPDIKPIRQENGS